jgi:hypothetical protein
MKKSLTVPKRSLKKSNQPSTPSPILVIPADSLLSEVRLLIESAREQTARAVNSALVGMYWHIGKRIQDDVLKTERAEYGEHIVQTLSAQLTEEYGRGFGRRNLFRMIQFAEYFPDRQIVSALSAQLSWSHFTEILSLEAQLKRDFYAEMCRIERWSVRTLRHKIGHLLFERTAVAKQPDKLIEQDLALLRDADRMTPELVFRDPYLLDCHQRKYWRKSCTSRSAWHANDWLTPNHVDHPMTKRRKWTNDVAKITA